VIFMYCGCASAVFLGEGVMPEYKKAASDPKTLTDHPSG